MVEMERVTDYSSLSTPYVDRFVGSPDPLTKRAFRARRHFRVKFDSVSTARSAIQLIVAEGMTKSFARIENTSISPSRVWTKPESERTFEMEPVFARAFPS